MYIPFRFHFSFTRPSFGRCKMSSLIKRTLSYTCRYIRKYHAVDSILLRMAQFHDPLKKDQLTHEVTRGWRRCKMSPPLYKRRETQTLSRFISPGWKSTSVMKVVYSFPFKRTANANELYAGYLYGCSIDRCFCHVFLFFRGRLLSRKCVVIIQFI